MSITSTIRKIKVWISQGFSKKGYVRISSEKPQYERYTQEHLNELNAIKSDAIRFTARLRSINQLSPSEEAMFKIFLNMMDKEIFEVKFILDLEKFLSE